VSARGLGKCDSMQGGKKRKKEEKIYARRKKS
jgi:hypothetical protein